MTVGRYVVDMKTVWQGVRGADKVSGPWAAGGGDDGDVVAHYGR